MITDGVVNFFIGIAAGLLSLIPGVVFVPIGLAFGSVCSFVQPYFAVADWILPIHEAIIVFSAMLIFRFALILIAAVWRVLQYIPILGH